MPGRTDRLGNPSDPCRTPSTCSTTPPGSPPDPACVGAARYVDTDGNVLFYLAQIQNAANAAALISSNSHWGGFLMRIHLAIQVFVIGLVAPQAKRAGPGDRQRQSHLAQQIATSTQQILTADQQILQSQCKRRCRPSPAIGRRKRKALRPDGAGVVVSRYASAIASAR